MNFQKFTAEFSEENVYHFYFLSKEEYSSNYLSENEQAIKGFLKELSNHNLTTLKVLCFKIDVYIESDTNIIKATIKQLLY